MMQLAKVLLILVSAAAVNAFAQDGGGYGPPHAVVGHDPVRATSIVLAKAPRLVVARAHASAAAKTPTVRPR